MPESVVLSLALNVVFFSFVLYLSALTEPEVVGNLEATKITTSSVFLSWTEPLGNISFYRVQWTGGNMNQSETVNKTDINITELTAGQQYTFTVVAVAGDEKTLGEAKTVSPYTSKMCSSSYLH